MKKTYTEKDISLLSDSEHVKLRTSVYLGNTNKTTYTVPYFLNNQFSYKEETFIPAVYKAINEVLDNAVDELIQCSIPNKLIKITANPLMGEYTISDNGRGVPIGKHSSGKYTPEVVFGALRSGRNFTDDKQQGVIGLNGMGISLVNICSSDFKVTIHRDGKKYTQHFSNNTDVITKPSIRKCAGKTGTEVSFMLDPTIFNDITLPDDLLHNRAIEIAITNPGITVEYNKHKYKFKKGFDDVIKTMSSNFFKFSDDIMEFYVMFDAHGENEEKIFSWVNSSLIFNGGICNTQFLNAFYEKTISHLSSAATKGKYEISKNDVRKKLLIFGNLKLKNAEYDSQAKMKITGPNLRKEMLNMIDAYWPAFVRKHKQWISDVTETAKSRFHSIADKKAVSEHQKKSRKKIPGLKDATSKNRFDCKLFISEGDSAAANFTQVLDKDNVKLVASLPLRGKINNVFGATAAQVLQMGKLANLLTAIGLTPGEKAIRSNLRYGKIIIATDGDVDGDDINSLLINMFYHFWPELFDPAYEPIIFRLMAPNVIASKSNKRIHFSSVDEFNKNKHKYKNWEIEYMKGLGSLHNEDYKQLITDENYLLPFIDDGNMEETLTLLFGKDIAARKKWLTT